MATPVRRSHWLRKGPSAYRHAYVVDMKMTLTSIHSYVISLFRIIDLARISGN